MSHTYDIASESLVDVSHCTRQRLKIGTRLAALLEFALQSAEDVVKRQAALPWRTCAAAHPAHPDKTLRLHRRSPLRAGDAICRTSAVRTGKTERARLSCHTRALATERAICWRILLCFCPRSGLSILLGEDADDARCDFMVYDSSVVLANNVDTEFLTAVSVPVDRARRARHVPRYRRSSTRKVATRDLPDLVSHHL
jgi:hypothetical protein